MLGLVYFLLAFIFGLSLVDYFLDDLLEAALGFRGVGRKRVVIEKWWLKLPAGFLVGNLILGWLVYWGAYLFASFGMSLWWANGLGWGLVLAWLGFWWKKGGRLGWTGSKNWWEENGGFLALVGVLLSLSLFLMYYTFRVEGGELLVGVSVFSDFGPHLGLIRSFSLGQNWPTIYPHFPDGTIRYHFMFDFVVGNLEFLGLRIDHSFNLMSGLSLASFGVLLFGLASVLFGSVAVGILSLVLWFFRSSLAFWEYLGEADSLRQAGEMVAGVSQFIGKTAHEDWGLWAQNVYVNQRHLSFAWGILILGLILLLPLFERPKRRDWKRWLWGRLGWLPDRWKRVGLVGLLWGLLGFWNGAVVIAGLAILAPGLIFSRHRGELLGVGLLILVLVWLQKLVFIGPVESAVTVRLVPGFLAQRQDLISIVGYYWQLLGLFWLALLAGLWLVERRMLVFGIMFAGPFVLANLVQLTADLTVNHKYVLISVVFLNMFVAYFLWRLFKARSVWAKLVGVLFVAVLTVTGLVDLLSLINLDRGGLRYHEGEFSTWMRQETQARAVFLTPDMPVSDEILLSGRSVFLGWPYYAWSAGYDTNARKRQVEQIYERQDWELARNGGIDYVVFEKGKRQEKIDLPKVYEDRQREVFGLK